MTEGNQQKQFGSNYVTANRFYVEMENIIKASFTECQGLGVKLKREAYAEGGLNNQQRILVGPAEFTDVTLKRGITDDLTFLEWVGQVMPELIAAPPRSESEKPEKTTTPPDPSSQTEKPPLPKHTRRNVNILVFNQAGEVMQCWTLIGAVPIGWKAPALQANATTAAIEELTLAYEGLKVTQPKGSPGTTFHTEIKNNSDHKLTRDKQGYYVSK